MIRSITAFGLILPALAFWVPTVRGQTTVQIEDYEFATSDEAAEAGVTDVSDPENQPTFFVNGDGPGEASEGQFSVGTDALFGASGEFIPGSFIGFRREISTDLFPSGQVDLIFTYGDPDVPGPIPPDRPLSDLVVLGDFYGNDTFGEGLTGTNLWVNLIDAEGEKFNFINYSEASLYSEVYTMDVVLGEDVIRIDPESIENIPDGDRLLTEIVAFEVKMQDDDDPPTGFGLWYVDDSRIREPEPDPEPIPGDADGDGDVDLDDFAAILSCFTGVDGGPVGGECETFDFDLDTDVDFADQAVFQIVFTGGI